VGVNRAAWANIGEASQPAYRGTTVLDWCYSHPPDKAIASGGGREKKKRAHILR